MSQNTIYDVLKGEVALVTDDASSSVTYVGKADIGTATSAATWQIKKLVTTGTVMQVLWADGNSNYDNVWDNRASLSYS